jgi:hypothetical protein
MKEVRALMQGVQSALGKRPSQQYSLAVVSGVVLAASVLMYLLANRYVHHRHWMGVWNSTVAGRSHSIGETSSVFEPGEHAPGVILLDGKVAPNLRTAFRNANDGSQIQIGAGSYNEAAHIRADNVKIIAEPGAVVFGKAIQGKAAIVATGNNIYIEGLECHSIRVRDRNGACVRVGKGNLTLNRVYFHHAQTGLLQTPNGGELVIENSRFENLGESVFAHGIYTAGSKLIIRNSVFLNQRSGGHEIKSRSKYIEINGSVIAAAISGDSRLVDIPNGGDMILRDNVFVEGKASQNADLFSWSVEKFKYNGKVIIENNIIISDKPVANLLSTGAKPDSIRIENNVVVGSIWGIDKNNNTVFESRERAGLSAAPSVPRLDNYPIPTQVLKDITLPLSVGDN